MYGKKQCFPALCCAALLAAAALCARCGGTRLVQFASFYIQRHMSYWNYKNTQRHDRQQARDCIRTLAVEAIRQRYPEKAEVYCMYLNQKGKNL